jgi:hypothetical protein
MIAILLAQWVILEKLTFDKVPAMLKSQVKDILIDKGVGYLAK